MHALRHTEFVKYMELRSLLLCLICLGLIDIDEVIDMFKDLGVSLDRDEASKLIKRYR